MFDCCETLEHLLKTFGDLFLHNGYKILKNNIGSTPIITPKDFFHKSNF